MNEITRVSGDTVGMDLQARDLGRHVRRSDEQFFALPLHF
jgi:hypothetical protein